MLSTGLSFRLLTQCQDLNCRASGFSLVQPPLQASSRSGGDVSKVLYVCGTPATACSSERPRKPAPLETAHLDCRRQRVCGAYGLRYAADKAMYDITDDHTSAGRKPVLAALSLYLNFLNLFMMLLRLAGGHR